MRWTGKISCLLMAVQTEAARIRELTRTDQSEIVWDLDIYDPSGNQVRWGIYGGARIANFRGGSGN